MTYAQLFKKYPRYLSYGLLHSFFSGFGQTFFIAVFVPFFKVEFSLDSAEFGLMYSQATLLSACVLPFIGPYIDSMNLKAFSFLTGLGVAAGCLILGFSETVIAFFIGLTLVRFTGQGLMSHISMTSISRFFESTRGRALSIAQMGFPLSEGIWPLFITLIITHFSWRIGFFTMAGLILFVFLPLGFLLVSSRDTFSTNTFENTRPKKSGIKELWTESIILKDPYFYLILPLTILPPFLLTGLFISQSDIAHIKGWSMTTMATAFIVFAIFKLSFSIFIGPLVDKLTARRLLPYVLVPLLIAVNLLSGMSHSFAAYLFFALSGMSVGLGATVKSALWPEVYGRQQLGAIRSLTSPIVIFSTAVSPGLFGWYFKYFQSLGPLILCSTAIITLSSGLAFIAKAPSIQKS